MIYSWLIKYTILFGGIGVVLFMLYAYGNYSGRNHVQALWDSEKAATLAITSRAMNERIAENQAARIQSASDNKKLKEDYDKKIIDLGRRRHDGLYFNRAAACGGAAVSAAGTAAGRVNDPAARVRLPGPAEQNLRALADDANVCSIRLKALQSWAAGVGG